MLTVGSILGIKVCKPLVVGTISETAFKKVVTFIDIDTLRKVLVKLPSTTAFDMD